MTMLAMDMMLATSALGFKNFAALFSGGTDGLMIDMTDQTTLFQDANGAAAVVNDGDPVGLALDQHKWGGQTLAAHRAAQPELVTNGNFATDINGWTNFTGSISWDAVNHRLSLTTTGSGGQARATPLVCVVGRWYEVSVDVVTSDGNTSVLYIGTTAGGTQTLNASGLASGGTHRRFFKATATTHYLTLADINSIARVLYYDNVSVKEIDGNHAVQGTLASKPLWNNATNDVAFDGLNDFLTTDYKVGATVNFLGSYFTMGASSNRTLIGSQAGSNLAQLGMYGPTLFGYTRFGSAASVYTTTAINGLTGTMFGDRGASNTEVAVNGVTEGSIANAGTPPTSVAMHIGANNNGGTPGNYMLGNIKRILAIPARVQDTMTAADIHANLIAA